MPDPDHPPRGAAPAWDDARLADPHAAADKARRVERMFAAIAPSYDLNNRLHSLWRDQAWRRAAVRLSGLRRGETVCDVACGTGDLAMAFSDAGAGRVVAVDFTVAMLEIAQRKKRPAHRAVTYHAADAMALPIADASVDVVSIAFGIRNVADPARALGEFHRVLRPGGRVVVLEFTVPAHPLTRWGYEVYCNRIMPRTASWIARDRSGAYRYLPRSVQTFLDRPGMVAAIGRAGFEGVRVKPLTLGIAAAYVGVKSAAAEPG